MEIRLFRLKLPYLPTCPLPEVFSFPSVQYPLGKHATGLVDEIYHPNYVAKRMEIGAVMGAAPRKNVIRENSDPGDIILPSLRRNNL